MNNYLKPLGLVMLLVFMTQAAVAQKKFNLQANPDLVVSGTSSLHDWDMPSDQAKGTMEAKEESGKLAEIKSLKIEMPAESIKSGKRAMDKKAYDALKTKQHKSVIYTLKSASKSGDTWTLNGSFNIAGVTKNVSLKAKETSQAGGYTLKGSYDFKLSDYDITPPTALMGSIKTGDEVTISFTVNFK